MTRRFVAGNHLCFFSKKPSYKAMSVNEVLERDPEYVVWCYENLKHLRFATALAERIKKAKTTLIKS